MSDDSRITEEQARKWVDGRGMWMMKSYEPIPLDLVQEEIDNLREAGFEITLPPDPKPPYYTASCDLRVEVRAAWDEYGPATEGDLIVTTYHVNAKQEWGQARELALREAERRNVEWAGEITDDDIDAACGYAPEGEMPSPYPGARTVRHQP